MAGGGRPDALGSVGVRGGVSEARRVRRARPRWSPRRRRRQNRALHSLHVRLRLARVCHRRRLLQPAHRPRRDPRLRRRPCRLPVHRLRANPHPGDVPEHVRRAPVPCCYLLDYVFLSMGHDKSTILNHSFRNWTSLYRYGKLSYHSDSLLSYWPVSYINYNPPSAAIVTIHNVTVIQMQMDPEKNRGKMANAVSHY